MTDWRRAGRLAPDTAGEGAAPGMGGAGTGKAGSAGERPGPARTGA